MMETMVSEHDRAGDWSDVSVKVEVQDIFSRQMGNDLRMAAAGGNLLELASSQRRLWRRRS